MRIAEQHKWKDSEYIPECDWSDDTLVQWGGSGVVLGEKPYRTAFFEAFPPKSESAGGFIRGEGKTINEAETNAFAKYTKQSKCNHLWGREHYTNGGQLCRYCRAFRSGHLQSITKLGEWRRPVWSHDEHFISDQKERDEYEELMGKPYVQTRYEHRLRLQRKLFGVKKYVFSKPTAKGA